MPEPDNGNRAGPAADVVGRRRHRGLILIIIDVCRREAEEKLATIPGIRQYTNGEGAFRFRVALQRRFQGPVRMTYKIHVRQLRGPRSKDPETVITVQSDDRWRGPAAMIGPCLGRGPDGRDRPLKTQVGRGTRAAMTGNHGDRVGNALDLAGRVAAGGLP